MKPIRLTIAGLNSFEEAQTIDFESLTADRLFGIFGPTGSGKSSIIDAMTLALYGEMPRFQKEKRKEWINVNRTDMSVSFAFSLGGSGVYTAERSFKRTDDDRSHADKARLYVEDGGVTTVLADRPVSVNREAVRLIGLSYEDFTRSVLLPQGRFSEFLLLENKDRRMMLERIFRLEEYGETMNERIRKEASAVRQKLALAENGIAIYEKNGELTQAAIDGERTSLDHARAAAVRLRREYAEAQEAQNVLTALKNDTVRYASLQAGEGEMLLREPEMRAAVARVKRSEQAARVMPCAQALADTQKRQADKEEAVNATALALSAADVKEADARRAQEAAALRMREAYPPLTQAAADYRQALRVIDEWEAAEAAREKLLTEYREGQSHVIKARQDAEQARTDEQDAQAALNEAAARRAERSVDPAERLAVEKGAAEERRYKDCETRLAKYAALQEECAAGNKAAEADANIAEACLSAAREAFKAVRAEMDDARFRHDFTAAARDLTPGQPCPLCGSTQHPSPCPPLPDSEWSDISARYAEMEKKFTEAEQASREAETRLKMASARLDTVRQEYQDAEAAGLRQRTVLDEHIREAGTADFTSRRETIAAWDMERAALEKKEKAYAQTQSSARERHEKAAQALVEWESSLNTLKIQGQEKKAALEQRRAEAFALLRITGEDGQSASEIRRQAAHMLAEAESAAEKITRDGEAALTNLRAAETEKQAFAQRLEALTESREALAKSASEQTTKLEGLLAEAGFATAEAAAEACLAPGEGERLSQTAEDFFAALAVAKREAATLRERLAGQDLTDLDEQVNAGSEKIRSMEAETDRIKTRVTLGQERLSAMEADFEAVSALKKERAALTRQNDLLSDLADLFKGNAFVEYMAASRLRYITAEASVRLKRMTSGRYGLELDGSDFIMRDDYNGGVRRSPKSLSGGETFMAALCLALALSSHIQLKNESMLEFFFLDEGFGTLDPGALDEVMNALEQLPRERLTVGVISHVEEMRQRIPKRLEVELPQPGLHGTRVKMD